jgi:hypothetical protein
MKLRARSSVVERLLCMLKVKGSIPFVSISFFIRPNSVFFPSGCSPVPCPAPSSPVPSSPVPSSPVPSSHPLCLHPLCLPPLSLDESCPVRSCQGTGRWRQRAQAVGTARKQVQGTNCELRQRVRRSRVVVRVLCRGLKEASCTEGV